MIKPKKPKKNIEKELNDPDKLLERIKDKNKEGHVKLSTTLKINNLPVWLLQEVFKEAERHSNDYGDVIAYWYEKARDHERLMDILSAISEDYLTMRDMLFNLPCIDEHGEVQECLKEKEPEEEKERKINLLSGGDLKKD